MTYNLSTDAGRMWALLAIQGTDKVLRATSREVDVDGPQWCDWRLSGDGALHAVARDSHLPLDIRHWRWQQGTWSIVEPWQQGTWAIVEPCPKPVEEMTLDEKIAELREANDTEDGFYSRLVTEQRARKAKEARDAEIEAMTVEDLAAKYWSAKVEVWDHGLAALVAARTQQLAWTNAKTGDDAKQRLHACLVALAKEMGER